MACRNGPFGSLGLFMYGMDVLLSYSHTGRYAVLSASLSVIISVYHTMYIVYICWLTNMPVIVSYNSILNGLVCFIDMLYITPIIL